MGSAGVPVLAGSTGRAPPASAKRSPSWSSSVRRGMPQVARAQGPVPGCSPRRVGARRPRRTRSVGCARVSPLMHRVVHTDRAARLVQSRRTRGLVLTAIVAAGRDPRPRAPGCPALQRTLERLRDADPAWLLLAAAATVAYLACYVVTLHGTTRELERGPRGSSGLEGVLRDHDGRPGRRARWITAAGVGGDRARGLGAAPGGPPRPWTRGAPPPATSCCTTASSCSRSCSVAGSSTSACCPVRRRSA